MPVAHGTELVRVLADQVVDQRLGPVFALLRQLLLGHQKLLLGRLVQPRGQRLAEALKDALQIGQTFLHQLALLVAELEALEEHSQSTKSINSLDWHIHPTQPNDNGKTVPN
jgi:hypothetical protein